MQPLSIDTDALTRLAASRGIDTVRELARQTGVSEWVLYKALRSGHMRPSHVSAITTKLDIPWQSFVRDDEGSGVSA